MQKKTKEDLVAEVQELRNQLEEAQDTLDAIRRGEVDGLVVSTPKGEQVYTISGAERPYRALIEDMQEGAVMLSDDNTVLYCNQGFARIVKCPLEKVVGVKIERLVSPTHKQAFNELLTSGRDSSKKELTTKEITLLVDDQTFVPTQISVNSLRMDGTATTFLVVTDLSEHMEEDVKRYTDGLEIEVQRRIQIETALRKTQGDLLQSEKKYRRLYETSQDGFMARDLEGRMIDCNSAYERMTGYSKEELKNLSINQLLPEKWHEPRETMIKKVLETGDSIVYEREYKRKDGSVFPASVRTWPLTDEEGKTIGVWSIVRDITERKKAEEEISNLAKFPLENPAAVIRVDQKGILMFANPTAQSFLKEWQTKVGEFAPEHIRQRVFGALASGNRIEFEENLGEEIFSFLVAPITGEGYANLYGRNITEHKKTEEKLRASKVWEATSFYTRNLIEASLDPLVTISAEGKITDVNKATEKVTGCPRDELIGTDFSKYFTEPENAAAGYRRVFTEGFVTDYPLAIRHKSGKVAEVLYNASVYQDMEGQVQGVFAAARDVTELKKLEKKLQESERLATIGATAGMVGHDIRNPLQAITGDVFLAKSELACFPDSEEKKNALESMSEIEKNVGYMNKIVQDLQDYARPLNPNSGEADLKLIIDRLLEKNNLPENVKVSVEVEPEARKVVADNDYLTRILYNLVTNAVQAMPKGGKLTIHVYKVANGTILAVKDTGVGIPKEIQGKMFTPMFTTKSKGQGFGLPVVKRMTESLGGTVSFESEEGKGTTFTVRLPPPKKSS